MYQLPLEDRQYAGRKLAEELRNSVADESVVVLALPRGGVPVAFEIAMAFNAELDLMTVRKLGLPQHEELAMGAIASGGVRVLNNSVVNGYQISERVIDQVTLREQQELERREQVYRGDRRRPELKGRPVILVDDGIATGSTMHAAIEAVRAANPATITVAVPVAPQSGVQDLEPLVEEVVCLATPAPFIAVGRWYLNFKQTSDAEVQTLLAQAWHKLS